MFDALIAVAQNVAQKAAPKVVANTPQAQPPVKKLPMLFPDFTEATTAQYIATALDIVLVVGLLCVVVYALLRARRGPSPYESPPVLEQRPHDLRPAREPHQVVWSGFMVRVVGALTLVVTVVILFNCVTSGLAGTLLLAAFYGYFLRLLWPMVSDLQRAPVLSMAPADGVGVLEQEDLFGGGSGDSIETAVVIKADNTSRGILREHSYIARQFGRPSFGDAQGDWKVLSQLLTQHEGKHYDVLTIALKSGEEKKIYFDISSFFGKH